MRKSVLLDPAAGRRPRVSRHRAARDGRPRGSPGEPAARDRGPASDRRRLRRPGHHVPPGGRPRQGAGTARSRAEPPSALGARAGLELRDRGAPPGARREPASRRGAQRAGSPARPPGRGSSEVTSAFREAIRLRPDFAEAHNNLGLVLVQSGDDAGGIAEFREAMRHGEGLRGRARQSRRGPRPHRRRGSRAGAREGRRPGSDLREGPVQPRGRLRGEPRLGGRRRRSSSSRR